MIEAMTEAKKYAINAQKAISETIDNETILIQLETGCYYSMNPDATALWNALAAGKAIAATHEAVATCINLLQTDDIISPSPEMATETIDDGAFPDPKIEKYTDLQEMLLADPIHDVETAGWPTLKKE
jgi:hypothetical protein